MILAQIQDSPSIWLHTLLILAGIIFCAGIFHVFLWLRQRNRLEYLAFTLVCVSTILFILNQLRGFQVSTLQEACKVMYVDGPILMLTFFFFTIFVYLYAGKKRNLIFYILEGAFTILFLAFLFQTCGTGHGNITGITELILPWGERVSQIDFRSGRITGPLSTLSVLFLYVYVIVVAAGMRHKDTTKAVVIGLSGIVLLATIIPGLLIRYDVIQFVPLGGAWIYAGNPVNGLRSFA